MTVTKEWLQEEYEVKKRSFADIAAELKTYPNAIRRLAKKLDIKIRDKSDAQSAALKSGRHKHPTKGQQRSNETKLAISEARSKAWQNMSDEDYQARVEKGRQQWANMTEDERKALHGAAIDAIQKTAKEGSKLEKFVVQHLKDAGFLIEFHKRGFLQNDSLEVDIFLPEKNIAIEIDGPSHFLPIWGEDALQKTVKADNEKNGLLVIYGINVVRIKCLRKDLSMKNLRDIAVKIEKAIQQILNENRSSKGVLHTIEVE